MNVSRKQVASDSKWWNNNECSQKKQEFTFVKQTFLGRAQKNYDLCQSVWILMQLTVSLSHVLVFPVAPVLCHRSLNIQ